MQARIYRWYRELIELEREILGSGATEGDALLRKEQLERLASLEESVRNIRVPAAFADLFYSLREHIIFVRERVVSKQPI